MKKLINKKDCLDIWPRTVREKGICSERVCPCKEWLDKYGGKLREYDDDWMRWRYDGKGGEL